MLTCHYVAAIHGSSEQGEYCSSVFCSDLDRLEQRYKLSTLLFMSVCAANTSEIFAVSMHMMHCTRPPFWPCVFFLPSEQFKLHDFGDLFRLSRFSKLN